MLYTHPRFLALALLGALCAAGPSMAQGTMQLTNEVLQEVEVTGKGGKKEKKVQPATRVIPGSEVIYVITYRNGGAEAASDVVIDNPVPPELAYKGGSASGAGARFEVSVDGGRTYGVLPSLKVAQADGTSRPAQAEDVTHLRWRLSEPVPPGQQGKVSYRAVLK